MTDDIEVIRGSGNVYRDLGVADADLRQLKALLAAEVAKALDERSMTVRAAASHTGIAAADFSRIRMAKLDRFTIDRLMTILARLDRAVDVTVAVRPRKLRPALA